MVEQSDEVMARAAAVQALLEEEGVGYGLAGYYQDGNKTWLLQPTGVIKLLSSNNLEVANSVPLSNKCLALIEKYGTKETGQS